MSLSNPFDQSGGILGRSPSSSRPIHVTQEDEVEFLTAFSDYKKQSGRLFPTCSEVLEILKTLGYAKRIWKTVQSWERLDSPSQDGFLAVEENLEIESGFRGSK